MSDWGANDCCFSMSAFLAFVKVRDYRKRHGGVTLEGAIDAIKRIDPDGGALDFECGRALMCALDGGLSWNGRTLGVRLFVSEYVRARRPWWLRLFPYGRERVRSSLRADEAQCFRGAGLLETAPDERVIKWWDEIAASMRGAVDAERMVYARRAERLSLEHEHVRLRAIGIDREPRWVALDDNTLGYDILSYDQRGPYVVNRLIEVKSATANTVVVSRNEWDNAIRTASRTVFHVWRLPEQALSEYTVADLEGHVPADRGGGRWQSVKLELESP